MPKPEQSPSHLPGVVIIHCSLTLFLSLYGLGTPILEFMGTFHKFLAFRDPLTDMCLAKRDFCSCP